MQFLLLIPSYIVITYYELASLTLILYRIIVDGLVIASYHH